MGLDLPRRSDIWQIRRCFLYSLWDRICPKDMRRKRPIYSRRDLKWNPKPRS
jgi:hypothetical protein